MKIYRSKTLINCNYHLHVLSWESVRGFPSQSQMKSGNISENVDINILSSLKLVIFHSSFAIFIQVLPQFQVEIPEFLIQENC